MSTQSNTSANAGQPSPLLSAFWQEVETFKAPPAKDVAAPIKVGSKAPTSDKIPLSDGRPTLILFLRHCGCPFAEKTFKLLSTISSQLSEQVHCIAVSHSSAASTERWIPQVGGTWGTDVVVDEERDIYAQWGLGLGTTWQTLGPSTLYSVLRLTVDEGIHNRPSDSGSRWQKSGAFAVDADGIVRWAHVSRSANDLPDLAAAVKTLGFEAKTTVTRRKPREDISSQGEHIKY